MFKGYKMIDADGHVMEPVDLWDRYLDPEFRHYPVNHVLIEGDPPSFSQKLWLNGTKVALLAGGHRRESRPKYILGKDGVRRDYGEAYSNWIRKNFSPGSYLEFMELTGWDFMVLYPTACLFTTTMPGMDPKVAAALCRAYNSWLSDFCNGGGGRLLGSGKLDTRDPELAAKEARRCVKELGFKAVHVFPQMEEGTALSDPEMDVLWSEISDLNVPLAIHMAQPNMMVPAGQKEVGRLPIGGACAFPMENMIAFLAMASGPLERFPDLKVIFLECSASWVPFWIWWLDDRWERAGENVNTIHPPSFYWRRQCYVSAEPDEPGIKYVKDFQGDDNILTNSDFPHPEDATFPYLMEKLMDNPDLTEETKRKILWDNPDRLYHITT